MTLAVKRFRNRALAYAFVLLLTIPAWWALGLDQAAWLLIAGLLALQVRKGAVSRKFWVATGALSATVLLSGVLGASGFRWLTLVREFLIVLAFLAALLGVAGHASRHLRPPSFIIYGVATVLALSAVASVTSFAFQLPLRFETPIAPFVPPFIAESGLGAASFMERSLAEESYFLHSGFLRPQGLFLFSTSQAVAFALFIPVVLATARRSASKKWWLWGVALALGFGLIVTTTRMPVVALAGAAVLVVIARGFQQGGITISVPLRGPRVVITLGALVILAAGVYLSGAGDRLVDVLTTRSLEGRAALYEKTFDSWLQRPIVGWGTEHDWTPTPEPSPSPTPTPSPSPTPTAPPSPTPTPGPADRPPLGSHSQYLGLLFKQGVVGLAIFLALAFLVGARLVAAMRVGARGADLLAVAFIASLLTGLTESLWLDPATAIIAGVSWGLAYSIPGWAEEGDSDIRPDLNASSRRGS